jgi:hypothetical protein
MRKEKFLPVLGLAVSLPLLLSPFYQIGRAAQTYTETAEAVETEESSAVSEDAPSVVSGWDDSGPRRRYIGADGAYLTGLQTIDGVEYYFSSAGSLRSGWIDTEEGKRYAGADGALVTGEVYIKGQGYYFGDDGLLQTGWLETETGTHFATGDGYAALTLIDGVWLDSSGTPVSEDFTLTDEQLASIDALLADCPANVSLVFEDLLSGRRYSWNEQKSYFIASVYKLPYCLWLFQQADEGLIDLDSTITYTAANHKGEAGVIQYSAYGTEYTLHELIADALIYSDNTALAMLKSVYPYTDFDEWINTETFALTRPMTDSTDTMTDAADCAVFARMAYDYMMSDAPHAAEFAAAYTSPDDYLIRSDWTTGQKYGWWTRSLHTCTVVFADRPFSITICTDWEDRTEEDEQNIQRIYEAVEKMVEGGE